MSDEDESLIEKTFVTGLGAKYPFVKAKGVNELYGIKFFPSVFCIDAKGIVHSVPDDHMPTESAIEELLKDVSLVPSLADDSRYGPVRSMWEKQDYSKLRDYLGKMLAQDNLDASLRETFTALSTAMQKRAELQQSRVERLAKGPDYVVATDRLERIEKVWKGFPAADAAKEQLARFAADAAIKKELVAGKALQKLLKGYDPSKASQAKKLVAELGKFTKKYEGTYAAKQADEQRQRMTAKD